MGFRRDGKAVFEKQRDWAEWLSTVSELTQTAGLPPSVIESEEGWWYFIDKSYSQTGYLGQEAWFSVELLSSSQAAALWRLLCKWLQDRWPDATEDQIRSLQQCYRPLQNEGA